MDHDDIIKTIDNFDKGVISRERFIDYLRTQMEQGKNEKVQLEKQMAATQVAAKMAQRNVDRNATQGVGNAQEVSTKEKITIGTKT